MRSGGRLAPYVLVALATLVRFEDLFVVAGLVVASWRCPCPAWRRRPGSGRGGTS